MVRACQADELKPVLEQKWGLDRGTVWKEHFMPVVCSFFLKSFIRVDFLIWLGKQTVSDKTCSGF